MTDKRQILVTFSSTPSRISKVSPVIRALKHQTFAPDQVNVWLCPYYKRLALKFEKDGIPSFLTKDPFVKVKLVEDCGPGTKLIPLLQEGGNKDDIIIVIDDDRIPSKNFIKDLVSRIDKDPNAVYGYRGCLLDASLSYAKRSIVGFNGRIFKREERRVDILTGTGGIAFRREVTGSDYLAFWRKMEDSRPDLLNVDDILFNSFLAQKNIVRIVIPLDEELKPLVKRLSIVRKYGIIPYPEFEEGHYPDSLWKEHSDGLKNDRAINFFKQVWESHRVSKKEA
jgi:hypothetical protein